MSKTPRCRICNVPMTRIKGRPPVTCSRSVCKKKYAEKFVLPMGTVSGFKSRWEKPSDILSETEMREFQMQRD